MPPSKGGHFAVSRQLELVGAEQVTPNPPSSPDCGLSPAAFKGSACSGRCSFTGLSLFEVSIFALVSISEVLQA